MGEISIKVPARICFFGDHQDYLGLPVIAGSIDRFIELKAYRIPQQEFQLVLRDITTSRTIPLDISGVDIVQGDYLSTAIVILRNKGFVFREGYCIEISGNIPVNAGLSSSSALTVAWIRFLVAIQEKRVEVSDVEIGHWAYETEVEFFNGPGGLMDQYTIAQQGLIFIDTRKGETERLTGRLGKLIVAESGISKETLNVLNNARIFQERAIQEVRNHYPEFKIQDAQLSDVEKYKGLVTEKYQGYWYAAVNNYDITVRAKESLKNENSDLEVLGELMNMHQRILESEIKNTPEPMVQMMNAARKAGALGAKTIGSGGGGCMVALLRDDVTTMQNVVKAFLDSGAKTAYEVELTYPEYEK